MSKSADPLDLQRYDIDSGGDPYPDPEGSHVRYDDAAAALVTLTADRDQQTRRADEAERERDEARNVVYNTLWMAGRYADGRMTYAVGLYNDMREIAQCRGGYDGGAKSAHDGMSPEWPTLTERLAQAEAERDTLRAAATIALSNLEWRQHNFPNEHGCAVRDEAIRKLAPLLKS